MRNTMAACRAVAMLDELDTAEKAATGLMESAAAAGECWLALSCSDLLLEIQEHRDAVLAVLVPPCPCWCHW